MRSETGRSTDRLRGGFRQRAHADFVHCVASRTCDSGVLAEEVKGRDSAVTAIRHVLPGVAAEHSVVPSEVVAGLGLALDQALDAYAESAAPARVAGDDA
jgi:hypothetical protein